MMTYGEFEKYLSAFNITPGGGDGDVYGPSSSVDSALVQFDGVTGKLIKQLTPANSSILATDSSGVPVLTTTLPVGVQQNITKLSAVTGGSIDGVIIGGVTPAAGTFSALIANTSAQISYLSTGVVKSSLTGVLSSALINTADINNNQVTYAKLQQVAALSILGNAGNSAANVGEIVGTANQALVINSLGTSLGFSALNLASSAAVSGILGLANGGLNAAITPNIGGIFYSTASAAALLNGVASANRALLSGASAAPTWSSASYPASTTINQLLYSSSANTITGLATVASSVLVTDSGGVPSLSATLPIAVQQNITKLGAVTGGSIDGVAIGNTTRAAGSFSSLTVVGDIATTGLVQFQSLTNGFLKASNTGLLSVATVDIPQGGTNITSYTIGDILYASGASVLSKLAGVATGNALISGGVGVAPSWNKIDLTTTVSNTLGVTNGGTGRNVAYTQGAVLIAGASGTVVSQDPSNFSWDSTNHRLTIGTTTSATSTSVSIFNSTQASVRLTLTGQEFSNASNTSTEGFAFALGVNRTNNKQLWMMSSAAQAVNSTNQVLRIGLGSDLSNPFIDAIATDGSTKLDLSLNLSGGNVCLFGNALVSGGAGVLFISNRSVVPAGTPLGGGFQYSEGGAAKWKGSSGTTTTYASSEPHCQICGSDFCFEAINEKKYGHLIICWKCLSADMGDKPYIRYKSVEQLARGERISPVHEPIYH